ncbi:MAG: LTA synthase family protein [Bacteroidales bacterium]
MKKQLAILLSFYGFWIMMFVIQKPLFMLFNHINGVTLTDYINVIYHGFKLDFCFAAYFLFFPILLLLIRVLFVYNIQKILLVYNTILGAIISIVFAVDCVLYSYWSFRIDATLIFYLRDFNESLNSVTIKDVLKFILIAIPYFFFILFSYKYTINKWLKKSEGITKKGTILFNTISIATLIICIPIFIIFTRGGISAATANVGMVYYCNNQKLNLAAVNPSFNLIYSLTKNEDFGKKYQFYDENFCKQEFDKLLPQQKYIVSNINDFSTLPLKNKRPNIVIIILESFSGRLIGALDGHLSTYEGKEVTPNLNKIAKQSIVFTNAYSNGMRTDRGIVSILTGFLAQPDMSIIKYPEKTATLPSIAKTLGKFGYNCEMIYGGDINFANMRSFFYGSNYKNVIDYKSFELKDRLSKWGVSDEKMFDFLISHMQQYDTKIPFFTTFLTLSSHEPFDVNMHKFKDAYVNSVAYTDSCLGVFFNALEKSPLWKNTLVVLVADHTSKLPKQTSPQDIDYYHIPIIFSGGAIEKSMKIDKLINQTDIPKTILTAMNLPCEEFMYSRNIFNFNIPNYAFFVYTNGFGFLDSTGVTFWDNDANKCVIGGDKKREMKGKVLLQTLYKDISKR